MKLRNVVILAVKGADVEFKRELAKQLNMSMQTFYRALNSNEDTLTKASGMKMIRELTGMTDDEILEPEVEKA